MYRTVAYSELLYSHISCFCEMTTHNLSENSDLVVEFTVHHESFHAQILSGLERPSWKQFVDNLPWMFKLHEICSVDSQKIIKIVVTRCHFLRLKCTKFVFGCGSASDPAGRAFSAPPAYLAIFEGPTSGKGEQNGGMGWGKVNGRERGRGGARGPWISHDL